MICHAASRTVTGVGRRQTLPRLRRAEASRSSRLRCFVHFAVTPSTALMMAAAFMTAPPRCSCRDQDTPPGDRDAGNSVVVVVGDLAIVEALHLAAGGRE